MDLDLVPLTELCDAVIRRSETAIIMVHTDNPDTNLNGYWNWKGDYYKAVGLCEEIKNYIMNSEENPYERKG